jgi:membrane protease YdiL (CAAX protease family)
MQQPLRRITIYIILTVCFSMFFYVSAARHGLSAGSAIGTMWCPGLAAIVASLLTGRSLREIGWSPIPFRYVGVGWITPMLYAWPAYILVWVTGFGAFPDSRRLAAVQTTLHLASVPTSVALVVIYAIVATAITLLGFSGALGEEIGWRGFLVPELSRVTSFTKVSLISGTIWALWHFPLIIFANYHSTTPAWYALTCFFLMVVGISFAFAWVRLKSGSVWAACIMHASHNAIIQTYLTPLTTNTGKTAWFVDEFGAAMLPFILIVAFYFWRRRSEVEGQPSLVRRTTAA